MFQSAVATIYVADLNRALRFYTETLGCRLQYTGGGEWAQLDAGGGFQIGLHLAGPHSPKPGASGSISVGFYFKDSLDDVVARLKSQGVEFRGPIMEDTAVRLAFFGDPDGNDLYLCEVKKWG